MYLPVPRLRQSAVAVGEVRHLVSSIQRTAVEASSLRLGFACDQVRASGGRIVEACRPRDARRGSAHASLTRLQHPEDPLPRHPHLHASVGGFVSRARVRHQGSRRFPPCLCGGVQSIESAARRSVYLESGAVSRTVGCSSFGHVVGPGGLRKDHGNQAYTPSPPPPLPQIRQPTHISPSSFVSFSIIHR